MTRQNDLHPEDETLEGLIAAASREMQERRLNCPPVQDLERLFNGETSGEESARLEAHMASCRLCEARFERGDFEEDPYPDLTPGKLLGSALILAILGPEDAPVSGLRSLKKRLEQLGARVSSLSESPMWAAFDVSSGDASAPVDREKVEGFVRQIAAKLDPTLPVGMVMTVGAGADLARAPYGPVVDQALELVDTVSSGHVLLDRTVQEILRDSGLRLRTGQLAKAGLVELEPFSQSVQVAPSYASLGRRAIPAMWAGAFSRVSGAKIEAEVRSRRQSAQVRSRAGSEPGTRLQKGDVVQIRYEAPTDCYLYLLIEQGSTLRAFQEGAAIREPGQDAAGKVDVTPRSGPGPLKPHLLFSLSPLPGLNDVLQDLSQSLLAGEERLEALAQRLLDQGAQSGFALVPAGQFDTGG